MNRTNPTAPPLHRTGTHRALRRAGPDGGLHPVRRQGTRSMAWLLGSGALAAAVVFMLWLPLGIAGVVPFVLELPGESQLRTHAAAAVLCLLVAAWGFWEREP